jgi:hypothetical protein
MSLKKELDWTHFGSAHWRTLSNTCRPRTTTCKRGRSEERSDEERKNFPLGLPEDNLEDTVTPPVTCTSASQTDNAMRTTTASTQTNDATYAISIQVVIDCAARVQRQSTVWNVEAAEVDAHVLPG